MAHPDGLSQWTATVAKELAPLSPAQARVLALWSYGMVLTQSCACHTIAVFGPRHMTPDAAGKISLSPKRA